MELESLLSSYVDELLGAINSGDRQDEAPGLHARCWAMIGMLQEQREETSDDPDACPKCGVCHGCGVECADV